MLEHPNSAPEPPAPTRLQPAIHHGLIVQIRQKSLLTILISWLLLALFYASPETIRFSNPVIDKQIANLIWQLPLTAYGLHLLFASPRERLTLLLLPPITLFLTIGFLGLTQGSITNALHKAFRVFTSTNLKLVMSQPADDGWSSNTYNYVLPSQSDNRQCKRQEKRLTAELLQVRILGRLEDPAL